MLVVAVVVVVYMLQHNDAWLQHTQRVFVDEHSPYAVVAVPILAAVVVDDDTLVIVFAYTLAHAHTFVDEGTQLGKAYVHDVLELVPVVVVIVTALVDTLDYLLLRKEMELDGDVSLKMRKQL